MVVDHHVAEEENQDFSEASDVLQHVDQSLVVPFDLEGLVGQLEDELGVGDELRRRSLPFYDPLRCISDSSLLDVLILRSEVQAFVILDVGAVPATDGGHVNLRKLESHLSHLL